MLSMDFSWLANGKTILEIILILVQREVRAITWSFFSRHFKHNVLSATYQKMADLRNRCLYCKFPGNREKIPEWQSVYLMYENRHRWIINQFQVMRDHEFGPIRRSIIKFSIPCPTENYGRKSICWSEFHYILKDRIKSNSCPFYS